ncbi:hypothetical protein [Lysinibacillus antri]|uniref:Uncharacterized protein n=1 Tax=Lysinibacillus antri TaxID=2498145 RepID=A0A3S0RXS0_9BACI|nr:hypothetical protein [Lysinibacillus antri]RUL56485.1 hypothetical protein EK386_02305 [Lysinibacillus antri]
MQTNRNGIPLDVPRQRKKVTKIQITKNLQNDFNQFTKFVTMQGKEDGHVVTVIVPKAHPEYQELRAKKFRKIEEWDWRETS